MPVVPVEVWKLFTELCATNYTGTIEVHMSVGEVRRVTFEQNWDLGKHRKQPVVRIIVDG